jgi:hypothetical protein
LLEEISSQSCDPFEYGESDGRLENEQGNSLLKEETYYYGWPGFCISDYFARGDISIHQGISARFLEVI